MKLIILLLSTSWVFKIHETHGFTLPGKFQWRAPNRQGRLVHAEVGDKSIAADTEPAVLPRIIPTKGVLIHLYSDEIDPKSLEQLTRLAESPIPTDYVSVMPDVHLGKGVTVGTVFASEEYVCPNAVGVDIGCGMAAVPIDGLYKGQLTSDDLNEIQQQLKERIPTGFNEYSSMLPGTKTTLDEITAEVEPTQFVRERLLQPKVLNQLGTLGGGNHFLELVNEEGSDRVWIMLHSGSRNIGHQVASHYNEMAKLQLEKKGVDTQSLKGLNYMPIESEEGRNYLKDMEWCQRYAFHNRKLMKESMLEVVEKVTGKRPATMAEAVNIHHNYCACEDCGDGRKLWITRKGATSAKVGEMGIIPGSMGVGSYITKGKGNLMSWNSAAHGAGRTMSRTTAREKISQEDFEESMKGVVCDTHPNVKDEAPQAYKDLSVVMKNQECLTEVVHRLLPLVNVKGFEDVVPKKYRTKKQQQETLKQEKEDLSRGVHKLSSRLQSTLFVEEAAPKKVAAARAKLLKLEERMAKIDLELASLTE